MKVSVSGKQFKFPRTCACCGAYPLVSLPVAGSELNRRARTGGWIFEVPYCLPCRWHIRAIEHLSVASLLLGAVSLIVTLLGTIGAGRVLFGLEILGFLLAISGSFCAIGWLLIRRKLTKSCCQLTRSVRYLGSHGTVHGFDICSKWFFAEFVRDNHRKIVNASPQVASILKGTRWGDFQVPRRLLRSKSSR